jgi:perosamine synthetase
VNAVVPWWKVSFDEREAMAAHDAILGKHISQGELTARLEREIAERFGVPHALCTTSGSAALHIALKAAGIGPGDEILVPDRTFVATANAAVLLGAKVRTVEVLPDLPMIDPDRIEAAITPRTRAILVVHLNGRICQMDRILDIAGRHGLLVLEDAAQAAASRSDLGAAGNFGIASALSFSVAKLFSTGQGGAVLCRTEEVFRKAALYKNHSVQDTFHSQYPEFGFNFKFTDIQAAVGLAQLGRIPEKIGKLDALYRVYARELPDTDRIRLIPVLVDQGEVPLYIEVLCPEPDSLAEHLRARGIETRPFHPSLHRSPYLDRGSDSYANSLRFDREGLFLPSGPDQDPSDASRTCEAIASWAGS